MFFKKKSVKRIKVVQPRAAAPVSPTLLHNTSNKTTAGVTAVTTTIATTTAITTLLYSF